LRRAGVEVLRIPGRGTKTDLCAVVAELGRREILSALLEAGATLNSAALAAGIVDKLRLFFAPRIAGFARAGVSYNGLRTARMLNGATMTPVGPDFAVEGYLRDVYGNR